MQLQKLIIETNTEDGLPPDQVQAMKETVKIATFNALASMQATLKLSNVVFGFAISEAAQ